MILTRKRAAAALAVALLTVLLAGFFWLRGLNDPGVVSLRRPLPAPAPLPGRVSHVVLLSVDGLRPDAIPLAGADHLLGLMTRGAHCTAAETISLSITLPSHASMVTGLGEQRHAITWNDYRPGTLAPATIFSIAARSNLSTAMLFSKDKFHYLAAPEGMNWIYGPAPPGRVPRRDPGSLEDRVATGLLAFGGGTPAGKTAELTSAVRLAREFARDWQDHPYQLTFLHFRETDVAGHAHGWMGAEYLQAVEEVDYALGIILSALESSGSLGRTVVIVTADHGGSGRGHFDPQDPRRSEHVRIPWICAGPGVPPGLVIDRPVRTMDTAPTILTFLGLPLPDGIDGVPVREVLADAPAYRTTR